ncbi:uncharacterized protein Z519_02171 [Cladophialophora bantiana CBS 173.52]|uniref:Major facilitator superfamily (MFS) profile domain-containing protein n=1 Tax=Cladophialophora bantiana (strain ATCC 10958 / CBS 173.52 / CDC B-1940 / NIH 8579) TaxID=1442370 RepID=A0A0D2I0S0_CLAB1|nr:uncharacterized protein Z519_02171 [Cladophialophora bantiana CBS 173.52]KIW96780.1 hypothetical protein Z519_02171 [Cladophialophora bantiana CBS 173.52]
MPPINHPRRFHSKLIPQSTVAVTALIISVSIADSLLLGYDSSLMGALNVMPAYTSYFTLNTATKSLNTAISYIGGAVASFPAGFLGDFLGRKKAIVLSCIFTIIGAIIQTAAQNIAMFIIGRFIIGVGLGIGAVSVPTYIAETAPEKWRAVALGLYLSNWAVGTIIASAIGWRTEQIDSTWAWRGPSLIQVFWALLCVILLLFVPESPRWLIGKDRHEEALEALAIVNAQGDKNHPVVILHYREITDTVAWEKTEGNQLSLKDAYLYPSNRKRLMLATTFSIIVMFPGTLIITYYFGDMLTLAGITDVTSQLQVNIILQIWTWLNSITGAWLLGRMRRKLQASLSMVGQIITFFIFAGLVALYGSSTNTSGTYGAIAMMFLYNAAYGLGINALISTYPPEVLSYRIRSTGMGLYTFCNRVGGVFVTMVFPFAMDAMGWKFYILNAAVDILMLAFIIYFWVETYGLTLEEIDVKFDGVKHSDVPDLKDLLNGDRKAVEALIQDINPTEENMTTTIIVDEK